MTVQHRAPSESTWDARTNALMVTLRRPDGMFLNIDGTELTPVKIYAYRGTLQQARAMREQNPLAKGLTIIRFNI